MRVSPDQIQGMVQTEAYKAIQQRICTLLNESYKVVTNPSATLESIRFSQGLIMFAEEWLRAPGQMFVEQGSLNKDREKLSPAEQDAPDNVDEMLRQMRIGGQ